MNRKRCLVVLLSFLIVSFHSFSVFASDEKSIVLGFSEFECIDLDEETKNIVRLFPLQLMDATDYIDIHFFSATEYTKFLSKDINSEISKAKDAIASAKKNRDTIALRTTDVWQRKSELLTAEKKIKTAEKTLEETLVTQKQREDEVVFNDNYASISYCKINLDRKLLPKSNPPNKNCTENKLDMIVYGKIKKIDSYLSVEVNLYSDAIQKDVWTTKTYCSKDNIDSTVSEISRGLATALLGKEFCLLKLNINPSFANVYIDGEQFFTSKIVFLDQITHQLNVSFPGFVTEQNVFTSINGKDYSFDINLKSHDQKEVFIDSEPTGAQLFVDGKNVGITPNKIVGLDSVKIARLVMPGFDDVQIVLRPSELEDKINVKMLENNGMTFDEQFGKAKDDFYYSLGALVCSLPVLVITGGIFETYYQMAGTVGSLSVEDTKVYNTKVSIACGCFYSSIALTVGTAGFSIYKLVKYIKAAR